MQVGTKNSQNKRQMGRNGLILKDKICNQCGCEFKTQERNTKENCGLNTLEEDFLENSNPFSTKDLTSSLSKFGLFFNQKQIVKEVNVECRVAGDEISHHILILIGKQVTGKLTLFL